MFSLVKALIDTAKAMNTQGLNQGTSGNISVRSAEGFVITPSALPYEAYGAEDMVWMGLDGSYEGRRKPSSEWRIHRDIYHHFPLAGSILHAHSPWCTTLACLGREIPPFHYMVAVAGGVSIPCVPYATYGTQQLSEHIIKALQGRCACLLANHGMLCYAKDLTAVLNLAIEVEALARIYVQALQVGEPVLLGAQQMAEVLERFEAYKAGAG